MPRFDFVRQSNIIRSSRVMQAESIFEIPPSQRSELKWSVEIDLPESWCIGVIVGPSGSGKTTILREIFGQYLSGEFKWSDEKSILDCFPTDLGIKDIIDLLSNVGFSSPHSWLRPFKVLSNGEQFRVSMARLIAENREISIVDEFTSVVDRTVAKIGSVAIAKTIRKKNRKFIAASCHYDILDWLEPDWIYDAGTNTFEKSGAGRFLRRRPSIELTVKKVHRAAWELFRKYHYLDTSIANAAHCFVAFIENKPVAFCAVISFPHPIRPGWRFHRLVCLPDYQGVGIGVKFSDYVAALFKSDKNKKIFRTMSHPAVIHALKKSPVWRLYRQPKLSPKFGKSGFRDNTHATDRLVCSFEYVGESNPTAAKNFGIL